MLDTREDMRNDNYNEKYFMESQRAQKIADLEKDRIERYRSQFPRRGVSVSWHKDLELPNLKVGDVLDLPTVFGKSKFTVMSISSEGKALIESGEIQAGLIWQEPGIWRYNNRHWNKGLTLTVTTAV